LLVQDDMTHEDAAKSEVVSLQTAVVIPARINWSEDSTDTIVQKIRAADGFPGVQDTLLDLPVYLLWGST
jgi:hypothetical protein